MDLGEAEEREIDDLIKLGMKILRKLGYSSMSVLVKEGRLAKTIDHIHYHIIPNCQIGDLDHKGQERKMLTREEVESVTKDVDMVIRSENLI